MFCITGDQIKCEGLQIGIIIPNLGSTFCPCSTCGAVCWLRLQLRDIQWMQAIAVLFSRSCSQQIDASAGLGLTHFSISWRPLHAPTSSQSADRPLRCANELLFLKLFKVNCIKKRKQGFNPKDFLPLSPCMRLYPENS